MSIIGRIHSFESLALLMARHPFITFSGHDDTLPVLPNHKHGIRTGGKRSEVKICEKRW